MLLLPLRPVGNAVVGMEMMPSHKIDLDLIKPLYGQMGVIVPELLKKVFTDRIELIRAEIFEVGISDYFFEQGFGLLGNFSGHDHATDTPDLRGGKEMLC